MPKASMLQNFAEKVWAKYSDDTGKALIHMGAVGWFLSAAAQIGMIATNKDIDKKEKRFLIPQEIADGVINVGLYYTICAVIKKFGEKLIETGRVIPKTTHDAILGINRKDTTSIANYVEGMLDEFQRFNSIKKSKKYPLTQFYRCAIAALKNPEKYILKENTPKPKYLSPKFKKAFKKYNTPELRTKEIEILQHALRNLIKFKNGVGVITSVGGSILACNLITPIARNITANYYQKRLMERHPVTTQKTDTPINNHNLLFTASKTFNMFKI